MIIHPFTPDRQIGVVFNVEGSYIDVALADGKRVPHSFHGEPLLNADMGAFVLVDVGGLAAFGRVITVGTHPSYASKLISPDQKDQVPVQARVHLLSSIQLSGYSQRGIMRYPRVGDIVYAATHEAINTVLEGTSTQRDDRQSSTVPIGVLSIDESMNVNVPISRLFGRHLAVVGATGSGKSWTVAYMAESVAKRGGRMILIDATGEFHTLGDLATHVAFGSVEGEPDGTTLVSVPHNYMRESDRNAFLRPSGGVQLPKLREAVRSLKLSAAIQADQNAHVDFQSLISHNNTLVKAHQKLTTLENAFGHYSSYIQELRSDFDFRLLPQQIQNECVWPARDNGRLGKPNDNELSYVSSLVSRINDLLQTSEIMNVIVPPPEISKIHDVLTSWYRGTGPSIFRISLRNLTFSNNLREIIVNILGQTFLSASRRGSYVDNPIVVAIDEAHQFFNITVGDEYSSTKLDAFDSIAKEGRKFGLTVCLATQRPSDLPAGVLSQVGMSIVHRLADGRDRQHVERAAAELDHSATKLLPGLIPGEAILMGVDFPVPVSVRMSKPEHPPASDGPNYEKWTHSANCN